MSNHVIFQTLRLPGRACSGRRRPARPTDTGAAQVALPQLPELALHRPAPCGASNTTRGEGGYEPAEFLGLGAGGQRVQRNSQTAEHQ